MENNLAMDVENIYSEKVREKFWNFSSAYHESHTRSSD